MIQKGEIMKSISLYPADIYQEIDKSLLSEMDKLVLNMLYMPIIGSSAVSLYLNVNVYVFTAHCAYKSVFAVIFTIVSLVTTEPPLVYHPVNV